MDKVDDFIEVVVSPIGVDLPVGNPTITLGVGEIHLDIPLDLTPKELGYMQNLDGDKGAKRRQRIARYYFALNHTIRDIAEYVGISPSQVHNEVVKYRQESLKEYKKDLRQNKKILNHMVTLMVQCEHRINEIWQQYQTIEADASVLRTVFNDERDRVKNDPKAPSRATLQLLTDAMKTIQSTHSGKAHYLHLLKEETKMMLLIWEKFGLTGEEAMKIILSGGIDVDVKVQEVKTFLSKVVYIIQQEVKDENSQMAVFNRLANEIRESQFNVKSESDT